jgi:hypothetical protein
MPLRCAINETKLQGSTWYAEHASELWKKHVYTMHLNNTEGVAMTKIFPLPPFYKTSKKRGFTM